MARSTSDSSMVSSLGDFADETECLVRAEQKTCKRRASCQALPTARDLDHPAFQCIRNVQPEGQTVVTLSKLVTPAAMRQCLQFAYTGCVDRSALNLRVSDLNIYLEFFIHHSFTITIKSWIKIVT